MTDSKRRQPTGIPISPNAPLHAIAERKRAAAARRDVEAQRLRDEADQLDAAAAQRLADFKLSPFNGQASLAKSIRAACIEPGNLVRVKYEEDYKTAKGTGKGFKVQVNRAHASTKVDAGDLI